MTLDERLQDVTVLGAGGKMGSGISLLLAQEMTLQKLTNENKNYVLNLIDVNSDALTGLQDYLKKQCHKYAAKSFELLGQFFPGQNEEEVANSFAEKMSTIINPSTNIKIASGSLMIFEAIIENIELKVSVLKQLKEICSKETYFLSNTSSVPIKLLAGNSGIEGRIIGYHFYNPPAVQKLVELIIPENIEDDLKNQSYELGKRLRKIIILANDLAGFIGNGHFTRDGLHAIEQVEKLLSEFSLVQAVYVMNKISQEFLVRPMGIFQLIDYVGLDVFQSILKIMNPYFENENLHSDLIDEMVAKNATGGQFPDGSQKDGFLKYENHKPCGVYDLEKDEYLLYSDGIWKTEADEKIGELPEGFHPWRDLVKNSERATKLNMYFTRLRSMETQGSSLAKEYLRKSKEIGKKLIADGVANSADDVNGVLMNGFFHLYGPINNFV
jgi:3-hydroxyacyl-CoA dehydrogenase